MFTINLRYRLFKIRPCKLINLQSINFGCKCLARNCSVNKQKNAEGKMVKNVGRKFSLRKLVYQGDIRGCDIEYICTYTCRSEFDGKIYDRKTVLSHWSLQISSPSPWGLRSAVEFTNIISVIIFKFKEDIQPRPGAFGWTRGRIFTEIYAVKRLATVSERAKFTVARVLIWI